MKPNRSLGPKYDAALAGTEALSNPRVRLATRLSVAGISFREAKSGREQRAAVQAQIEAVFKYLSEIDLYADIGPLLQLQMALDDLDAGRRLAPLLIAERSGGSLLGTVEVLCRIAAVEAVRHLRGLCKMRAKEAHGAVAGLLRKRGLEAGRVPQWTSEFSVPGSVLLVTDDRLRRLQKEDTAARQRLILQWLGDYLDKFGPRASKQP